MVSWSLLPPRIGRSAWRWTVRKDHALPTGPAISDPSTKVGTWRSPATDRRSPRPSPSVVARLAQHLFDLVPVVDQIVPSRPLTMARNARGVNAADPRSAGSCRYGWTWVIRPTMDGSPVRDRAPDQQPVSTVGIPCPPVPGKLVQAESWGVTWAMYAQWVMPFSTGPVETCIWK